VPQRTAKMGSLGVGTPKRSIGVSLVRGHWGRHGETSTAASAALLHSPVAFVVHVKVRLTEFVVLPSFCV
jgi:hypothetical protein